MFGGVWGCVSVVGGGLSVVWGIGGAVRVCEFVEAVLSGLSVFWVVCEWWEWFVSGWRVVGSGLRVV